MNNIAEFFDSTEEMKAFSVQLKLLGIDSVHVEYSGGGDSGEIQAVFAFNSVGEDVSIPDDLVAWTKQVYGQHPPATKQLCMVDAIEDMAYRVLDATGVDWYNNDGGQGKLVIDLSEEFPSIHIDMEVNIVNTEEYSFDYDVDKAGAGFSLREESNNAPESSCTI